jgi:hypothetical protein
MKVKKQLYIFVGVAFFFEKSKGGLIWQLKYKPMHNWQKIQPKA